jgi:glutaredoxin 3
MTAKPDPDQPNVTVYTQAMCGYCSAARALLDQKNVDYDEISVTLNADLRREMFDRSGRRTVPQIFIDDRHIGGYEDMAALDQAGELDQLLGRTE